MASINKQIYNCVYLIRSETFLDSLDNDNFIKYVIFYLMEHIQDNYFIAIADYIKEFIDEEGIGISDLTAAANVDRKQIYRLMNKEHIPRLSILIRISLAVGIEPAKLFSIKFDFDRYMKENNILKAGSKNKLKY